MQNDNAAIRIAENNFFMVQNQQYINDSLFTHHILPQRLIRPVLGLDEDDAGLEADGVVPLAESYSSTQILQLKYRDSFNSIQ